MFNYIAVFLILSPLVVERVSSDLKTTRRAALCANAICPASVLCVSGIYLVPSGDSRVIWAGAAAETLTGICRKQNKPALQTAPFTHFALKMFVGGILK